MLFIFDAHCSQRLAEGLNLIETGNTKSPLQSEIKHIKAFTKGNATDIEIINILKQQDAILITYDKDFRHDKAYFALYKKHSVGVVFFRSYKNVIHYWDIVKAFIKEWEDLKKMCSTESKPFAIELNNRGFSKLHIK